MMLHQPITDELTDAVNQAQAHGVQVLPKAGKPGLYKLMGQEADWAKVFRHLTAQETAAFTKYLIKKQRGNK